MKNSIRPTFATASIAAAVLGSSAHANFVLDGFGSGAQSVTTASTTSYTSSASGSAALAAGSVFGNRQASAIWTTSVQHNGSLTQAQKLARTAGFTADTNAGLGIFNFGGRVGSAEVEITYNSVPGQWIDFASLGTGLRLDGALTTLTGATNAFFQSISIDVRVTDSFGVTANHTWFANTVTGGFTGLAGALEADFTAFAPEYSHQTIDFSSIASLEIELGYSYAGFAVAPTVSGSYELSSVSLIGVPAPGALALLGLAGVVGVRRRGR